MLGAGKSPLDKKAPLLYDVNVEVVFYDSGPMAVRSNLSDICLSAQWNSAPLNPLENDAVTAFQKQAVCRGL
jgi:hypothetical protein|eukprot:m.423954 g.423954  ORF g.423954 m.423954 type:complete len:72 (-) comp44159_c0_seq1:4591-4806(-)